MTYLVGKVLKLVLSIFVLLFYGFVIGKDVVSFVAAFIVFYFAFLFFETRFFLRFEAKLKLSKQANNEKITVHSNDTAAVAGGWTLTLKAETGGEEAELDVNELIFGHIGDAYEWHIATFGDVHLTIPLPVIVKSSTGWHVFSSSNLEGGKEYEGLYIAEGEPTTAR